MTIATVALFVATSAAIAALWNAFYPRIDWRFVILFIAIVAAYQSTTLFTTRVDLPAGLAFRVEPWKSAGGKPDVSNTGIVLTQLAPWTRVARDAILAGEWPLWNRYSGAGSPLLANQQTAIIHPFTLVGFLLLDIGKGFTYTASIRLFTVLFFTFALLRAMSLSHGAALFGAIAYAFCTFHIIWLLFPLGLATMMLPIALCGVRLASFPLLVAGLALSVLGGHPESAFWVWFATAAFALFLLTHLVRTLLAFITAAALTAFWWMPTVVLLSRIERTAAMRSVATNPPDHHLGIEWLEPLVAPNIRGTVQTSTYTPPVHRHPQSWTTMARSRRVTPGSSRLHLRFAALCAAVRTRSGSSPD